MNTTLQSSLIALIDEQADIYMDIVFLLCFAVVVELALLVYIYKNC